MAVTELHPLYEFDSPSRPHLHLVPEPRESRQVFRTGPLVEQRRAARAQMLRRRRRTVFAVALIATVIALCGPGHAFGGTTLTGLPSQLAPGEVYVVQQGDTLMNIARLVNPINPHEAFVALRSEIKSSVILPGEHVVIP